MKFSIKKTILSLPISYKNLVRFVGSDKLMGHAHKVINATNKSNPPAIANKIISLSNNNPNMFTEVVNQPSKNNSSTYPTQATSEVSSNTPVFKNSPNSKFESTTAKVQENNVSPGFHTFSNNPSNKITDMSTHENNQLNIPVENSFVTPPPPPLPSSPLFKNNNNLVNNTNFTFEQQLQHAKANLKSFSGKSFTSNINQNTSVGIINDSDLIDELKKRKLVKDDNGITACTIKDHNNNNVVLGDSKNKIKLTSLGQAYVAQMQNNNNKDTLTKKLVLSEEDNLKFIIALPPTNGEATFIESGKQKHLLLVYNPKDNSYYAIGYFTSTKTNHLVSETQFKAYQQKQDNPSDNIDAIKKPQFLAVLKFPERVNPNDIRVVKYSDEYVDYINKVMALKKIIEDKNNLPYSNFNKNGVTKEEALNMCKEHDSNIIKKKNHPQTDEQIKQQEIGKTKQKDIQMNKIIVNNAKKDAE